MSGQGELLKPTVDYPDEGRTAFPDGSVSLDGEMTEEQERANLVHAAWRKYGETNDPAPLIELGLWPE